MSSSNGFDSLIRDLQDAQRRIDEQGLRAVAEAMPELLAIARQVVHKRSHRMEESFFVDGPVRRGAGVLEAAIVPGVDYAIDEVDRGGEHNYVDKTIEAAAAIIRRLEGNVEGAVVKIIQGED